MNKVPLICCATMAMAAESCAAPPGGSPGHTPEWSRRAHAEGVPLPQLTGRSEPTGWAFGQTHGQPKATLICLHGIQTHADWFAELGHEAAREGWLLLCPDRRGSGCSARKGNHKAELIPEDAGGEVWARDLGPVLTAAKRKGAPIFVLGTSWGAKVALYAVANREELYPNVKLHGLILLVPATPAKKETGFFAALWISLGNRFFAQGKLPGLHPEEYLRKDCTLAERAWLLENMKRDSGKSHPPGLLMDDGQTPRLVHEGLRLQKLGIAGYKARELPAIAIFARGDQIVDLIAAPKNLKEIAKPIVWLDGAGHAVQVEAPGKIVAALRPWLEEHLYLGH